MLLRPSERLNDLLLYILAAAVERFEVLLHAHCFLSNHFHLVVTDPHGRLPAFEQYLAALAARACNALRSHEESFWAPGSYSAVRLLEPSDVVDKIGYTLANPVAAGLVRHASAWPGIHSTPDMIGATPDIVLRPDLFFREDGPMPAAVPLRLAAPPGIDDLDGYREMLRSEVIRREDDAAARLAAQGREFLGVKRILTQDPFSRPFKREAPRKLNPRIACRDEKKRKDALAALQAFLRAYRAAWSDFASGVRDVLFPHGTYWMRVAYGLPCAAAG